MCCDPSRRTTTWCTVARDPAIGQEDRVVAFDADVLRVDPRAVAGQQSDDPEAPPPACQAAVALFRTASMFRTIFTAAVALLAIATVLLLIWCLWRISDQFDTGAAVAAAGTVVTGTAAGFLSKKMGESIRVARQALADVNKYCPASVQNEIKPN